MTVAYAADAVILAVDPGADDGSAVFHRNTLVESQGVTCTRAGRERLIRIAHDLSGDMGIPLVCVVETWTQHRKRDPRTGKATQGWTFETALRCGEQAGRWLGDMEEVNPHGIVRVKPLIWRAQLWGGRHMKTDAAKAKAIQHARQAWRVSCDDNEAEAICIGHWSVFADDVHAIVRAHAA